MKVEQLRERLAGDPLDAVQWSVLAIDVTTGERILEHQPTLNQPTASLAKVFVLVELAEAFASGRVSPHYRATQGEVAPVWDSGLWRHLTTPDISLQDAAVLVGAVSDNLATNVLLNELGLPVVQSRAAALAPCGSTLLDVVRDHRGPEHAPTLSTGCAEDWAALAAGLARGEIVDREVSAEVVDWLTLGVDLSMVAGGFGLDPLAHSAADGDLWLWSKTGSSPGVRADVGVASYEGERVAWAAIAGWDPATVPHAAPPVLAAMRSIGEGLASRLGPRRPAG